MDCQTISLLDTVYVYYLIGNVVKYLFELATTPNIAQKINVKRGMKIHPVKNMVEVLKLALTEELTPWSPDQIPPVLSASKSEGPEETAHSKN